MSPRCTLGCLDNNLCFDTWHLPSQLPPPSSSILALNIDTWTLTDTHWQLTHGGANFPRKCPGEAGGDPVTCVYKHVTNVWHWSLDHRSPSSCKCKKLAQSSLQRNHCKQNQTGHIFMVWLIIEKSFNVFALKYILNRTPLCCETYGGNLYGTPAS